MSEKNHLWKNIRKGERMAQVIRTLSGKEAGCLFLGAVIYSAATHCFIEPAEIAPGGAMGIALMVNYLTGLPVGRMTLAVNLPLLILAWCYVSRRFALRTAAACVLCSLVLDYVIAPICPVYSGDRLMCSLYGGVLVGVGMGFVFLSGCTTGGSDIIGYLLQKKYPHVSIGSALLLIDGVILFGSVFVFQNMDAALFGMLSLYAQTKVIDAMIYGGDAGRQTQIVTGKPQEITKRVIQELDRTVTLVPAMGGYSGKETTLVLCTVRKAEFSRLKRIVAETDPDAFVIVTETSGVFGLGFQEVLEKKQ